LAQTIFERYGGFASISKIVSAFYDSVLESDSLAPYFDGIDMAKLLDHQTKFIASLTGGPASFSEERIERSHADLGINSADFDEAAKCLHEVLEDFEMDESDISTIMGEFIRFKRSIVTKH
jgi:hemoglobin